MYSPPLRLQPVNSSEYYVSGDVTIHEGATIAPGVVLQANPGSQMIIHAGVCIGIGSILNAHQGLLEVGEGVIIGSGVLLVGCLKIGSHACIGSATTILDSDVTAEAVVPPGSLLGDRSRSVDLVAQDQPVTEVVSPPPTATQPPQPVPVPTEAPGPQEEEPQPGINVYGQVYVNQLLVKLFPHRQHQIKNDGEEPAANP